MTGLKVKLVTAISAIVFVVIIIFVAQWIERITTVPYLYYGSLNAKEKTGEYIITVSTMGEKEKVVYFSHERKVLKAKDIEPLRTENWQSLVGKSMTDIIEQYGVPHADAGSGFYIPSYVTENAYLILICLDKDEIVSEIIVEDLLPGNNKTG